MTASSVCQNSERKNQQLLEMLHGKNIAIVGGGNLCSRLINFFISEENQRYRSKIVGVADVNTEAEGYVYADELGIFTTTDYTRLYQIDDLHLIVEITHDMDLTSAIAKTKPDHVQFIDHFNARIIWDSLQVEALRLRVFQRIQQKGKDPQAVEELLNQIFDRFNDIISHRNIRSRQIELDLVENQRTQSQIIQGSTIPTFVIDKNHKVTYWNKALEKLSGWSADKMVGTNRQWAPFWQVERPTMADVILDQIDEAELQKLYGSQWRKSDLIEGACEAEVFFSSLGPTGKGKWLWFTAAPLKAPDGTIVGAIETLWDKTKDKKAEQEREHRTLELDTLCSIYTALSAPWQIDFRIEAALKEIRQFFHADTVCIFLRNSNNQFYLKYSQSQTQNEECACQLSSTDNFIHQVVKKNKTVFVQPIDAQAHPEFAQMELLGFQSLAYVPISAKEQKIIGVLRIAGSSANLFSTNEEDVLELISNRIGVAVENAMLQEQYIKSEEKYRSLFNNDPNPIFIIDRQSLEIIDVNQRALDCYGYTHKEFNGLSFLWLGDEEEQEVKAGLVRLGHGQSVFFSKKLHFRKNGESFYVNINVSRSRYGESDALIATTTDISETMERETQLIQASKMTTLGVMAAGLAHEINQPLNVIQICADFFLKSIKKKKPIQPDDLQAMANDIVANVARATGIIKHVRDFARQSEVIKSRVNLNDPIQDVFKVLGHQIKVHEIELDLDLADDIPYIMADHNRLEQVFINLVTNAIDAMDEKAILPEYQGMAKKLRIHTCAQNHKVVATVADNGIGMSQEVQSKIFEPFFTTKKVGKGTGLGISIIYGIIKDYDGTIEINSREGESTTFTLTFPACGD